MLARGAPPHLQLGAGELSDIDVSRLEAAGLPQPPDGMAAGGVDIIARVRSRAA